MKLRWREGRRRALEMRADAFLREAPLPHPPQALKDHGAQRAATLASTREAKEGRHLYRRPAFAHRALLVSLLTVLLLAGAASGTYAASLDALPGSLLYGSKIFFERARLTLTVSRAEDARLEMEFSERRIREISRMAAGGAESGAERWLREYRRNLESAEELIRQLADREASELAPRFLGLLERQAGELESMRRLTPVAPALSSCLEKAYRVCDESRARMRMRCGEGGKPQESPGTPGDGGGKGCKSNGAAEGAPGDVPSTSYQKQESAASHAFVDSHEGGTMEGQATEAGMGGQAAPGECGGSRSGNHWAN